MAESLLKQVTGEDPLTARLLYAEFFTFMPTFKIVLAANHKPEIRGQDLGIWRRIHLVPFDVTIPEDKVDPRLPDALAAEASGILNWSIAGFKAWQEIGLQPPAAVRAATETYKAESDPLGEFFEEYVVIKPAARCRAGELFVAYQKWASGAGIKYTLTQKMLGQALAERGFKNAKGHGGVREWRGLGLR